MKIYLYGMCEGNAGPINVNRSLKENDKRILYPKMKNKIFRAFESIIKINFSKAVVISTPWSGSIFVLKIAKLFRKKILYLKHGDAIYEKNVNCQDNMEHTINCEKFIMQNCDLILCVSQKYMEWNKIQYPNLAYKMSFLNNGVDISFRKRVNKIANSIAVSGGNRNIKNNYEVYKAVKFLNDHSNEEYKLYVFGRRYENCINFLDEPHVVFLGQLEKDDYYEKLEQMQLFVVNSELEPFGLVVADALNTNCSLLISKNIGASSIIQIDDKDIIYDCHDVQDIVKKIKRLLNNGNVDQLQNSIDIESVSEKHAAQELVDICCSL